MITLTPGVRIVVSGDEPAPVHRALEDLQRDLRKVLGAESPVVERSGPSEDGPALVVAGPESSFGADETGVEGWEAHRVAVETLEDREHVLLEGADTRGTIYAIYTFCEEVLGVPPLWLWSSWEPQPREAIEVGSDAEWRFDPPDVKWRAWFPNDEDLLNPWRERNQEYYDAHLETMLRLKCNTLEGVLLSNGSASTTVESEADYNRWDPWRDEPYRTCRDVRLARDRGLAFTPHHVAPLGALLIEEYWEGYWRDIRDREPPELSLDEMNALKEALGDFWRYHVRTALLEDVEMVWTINFRGGGDRPFWESVEAAPESDAERAALIEELMELQLEILREETGEAAPPARAYLYRELSDLVAEGHLELPDDPGVIWNFCSTRRDHYPAADIRTMDIPPDQPVGYYLNFQFYNTGSHLAQGEGPWKMARNYRLVTELAPSLEFSVVNAGNVREHVLELAANARLLWDADGYETDAFLEEFCATYFGDDHSQEIAALYREFYEAYWRQRPPDIEGFERQYIFQDLRLERAAVELIEQYDEGYDPDPLGASEHYLSRQAVRFGVDPAFNDADTVLEALVTGTDRSAGTFREVVRSADRLYDDIDDRRRDFFGDNLRAQAAYMLHLTELVTHLARGVQALPDEKEAAAHVEAAQRAMNALRGALDEAEHDAFADWYDGDRRIPALGFKMAAMRRRIADLRPGLSD